MMVHDQYRKITEEADKKMKATNGHRFVTVLKTRCEYCGRSPKQKGKCPYWLSYFLELIDHGLTMAGVIVPDKQSAKGKGE